MFFARANVFKRQAAESTAHSRLTAFHFSHLGCFPLRSLLLCRHTASSVSLFMQVAVHLHNQQALLLRAASHRRQHRCPIRKRCRRHNGWVRKPRHGDPSALRVEEKWWHDSSRSPYWHYFKDDASFNEHSYSGVEFYDEFHMPRKVFEQIYDMLVDVPGFKDKKRGDGGRGMRSQPLRLKVCALVYILTDGGARPIYRAAQRACLGEGCIRRFFHASIEYLAINHVKQHVYLPRNEEELKQTEQAYAKSGFPGAFISILDVVHSEWVQCPVSQKRVCSGKEGCPR